MKISFGGRRQRIRDAYAALCTAMATADGACAAAAEDARREHLRATVELWLRQDGLDGIAGDADLRGLLTNPAFADVVAAVAADRADTVTRPAEVLPKLDALVDAAAPGSAGAPPSEWLGKVGLHTGARDVPGLWRIGHGHLGAAAAPFEAAVPLLDEAHLQITSHHDGRAAALGLVENLLLRVVSHFRPGLVGVHVWDVSQITGPLPRLHPLTRTGILHVHDPRGLAVLLDELSDRIRRIHRNVLSLGHSSVRDWTRRLVEESPHDPVDRPEPWTVVALVGDRRPLREEEQAALARVARGGLACGVHLVLLDVPITLGAAVETVEVDAHGDARTSMTGRYGRVRPDRRADADVVARACLAIAEEHENRRTRISTLADVLEHRAASSRDELRVRIGFADPAKVELVLDDSSPHALIGGPSGSGKTNLLLTWLAALATKYSPDELALYLLDFKEGVSFAQFAPSRDDPTYLPHARLLGLHVNTDREFGLALLQYLADEMRRRAAAAKERGVVKLADLREQDPDGSWPRIVAVIDEFQYLFGEDDAVTKAAVMLLEDVARRGRSQGIHLVLASQDVSGIKAFWGRQGIFEQFVLRIALPRARRVLDERNEAPLELPKWHAVINHESGMKHANVIARIPDASARGLIDDVRRDLFEKHRNLGLEPPAVFDGSRAPAATDLVERLPRTGVRTAVVGQAIDVDASPATVELPDAPGRNLAILGTNAADAIRVLSAAAMSAAATGAAATGAGETGAGETSAGETSAGEMSAAAADAALSVVLAPLVPDAVGPATAVEAYLVRRVPFVETGGTVEIVGIGEIRGRIDALAAEVKERMAGRAGEPVLLVLYAADAAETVLDRNGTDALRTLIHFGPETGIHVLGWWRTVPRLKNLLMMGAVVDDIGAWVALDVQGAELQPLLPGALLSWSPRPGRGLFFDRARHAAPRVVVVPGKDPS